MNQIACTHYRVGNLDLGKFLLVECGIHNIFAYRIQNPGLWNPEKTTQGTVIPLTIGIWNLSSTNKEAGIQYWNLESVLDCFTWGKNHYAIKPDNMQLYNSVL